MPNSSSISVVACAGTSSAGRRWRRQRRLRLQNRQLLVTLFVLV